jgi:NAD(P) transhydrogenase subunit alpha
MIIGVPAERLAGDCRVALVPDSVQRLVAKGFEVKVESGAGRAAWCADEEYRQAGAIIEPVIERLLGQSDFVIQINAPSLESAGQLRAGALLACLLFPRDHDAVLTALAARRVTTIAMENLPRTTMAQAMDVLSSQSTAAGYRAVILAASALAKFFPMLMTPAGTIAPAKVLILGAGVAGLQAIATARRLGASVEAFDVRSAVSEEVESLGAKFISSETFDDAATSEGYAREISDAAQKHVLSTIESRLRGAHVCITSALIPHRRAPILITAEMVRSMRPGSVIVDLAGAHGGNCQLTEPGKDIVVHGVTIFGRLNLPSEVAIDASRMYSRNMEKLIFHFVRAGVVRLEWRDEITRRCVVTHDGEIVDVELRQTLAANDGGAL